MKPKTTMFTPRLQTIGFFVLLAIALVLTASLLWPFLEILALSGILAVLFRPCYLWIYKKIESQGFAASITVLIVLAIVLVPLWLIGYVLFIEVSNVYGNIKNGSFAVDQAVIVHNLPAGLQAFGQSFLSDLSSRISHFASLTTASITSVVSHVANFFFAAFLIFFTLFFFLRDGEKIRAIVGSIFPLSESNESLLIRRLEEAIDGVVKGSFLVALAQGAVATVGFFIFGVPQPFIWGAFTVVAALVPTIGTSVSLIPAVLYLLLTGHTGPAVGMAIWGAFAVGLIDNFISPKLIGSRIKLHPLLVLFAVVGGLKLFGPLGFLLGPIVMAVFVALVGVYQTETKQIT